MKAPHHTDERSQALAFAEATARMLAIAEVSYYRRTLDARRLGGDRLILRAAAAMAAAEDFAEALSWDLAVLDQAGLKGLSEQILKDACRSVARGRHEVARGEALAGRRPAAVPCASEIPVRDRWASPGRCGWSRLFGPLVGLFGSLRTARARMETEEPIG